MVKSKKERKIDRVNSRYAFLKRKKSLIMKLRERTKQKNSRVSLSLLLLFFRSAVTESRAQGDELTREYGAHLILHLFKVSTMVISFFERSKLSSLRERASFGVQFIFICGRGEFFLDVTLESFREGSRKSSRVQKKGKRSPGGVEGGGG